MNCVDIPVTIGWLLLIIIIGAPPFSLYKKITNSMILYTTGTSVAGLPDGGVGVAW